MKAFGWLGKDVEMLGRDVERDAELAREEIGEGRFQRTMAVLTAFSAIVSGFEAYTQHQRGAFSHWLMWTPVWLTPPTAAASGAALLSEKAAHRVLPALSIVSLVDGVVGFFYHVRGIQRLPGGFKLGQYNVVMGPPVFAPLLTCIIGVLGLLAGMLRREVLREPSATLERALDALERAAARAGAVSKLKEAETQIEHGRFQRGMALTSAFFAVLAGGEAYFEHLRGSFNQRIMWSPVWVTPLMVAGGVGAAVSGRAARVVLPFVSAVTFLEGLLGFFLHLRGIKEMPGGFNNMRFNITMGPPLFAPLLFTSVGMLGFIAALLRRKE